MEERRAYPRIETEMPVDIVRRNEVIRVRSFDLSRVGMQLRCDEETAMRIFPDGPEIDRDHKLEVDVRLCFPGEGSGDNVAAARCQVIYSSKNLAGTFQIGLKFVRFAKDTYRHLEDYLVESMRY